MIEVFHFSEAAGHAENEDALEIRPLPEDQEGFVCVLADGQGGQAGGASAAQIACRTATEEALKIRVPTLLIPANWIRILQSADQAVFNDPKAGLTTLVGFCLTADFICGGSCGDSAAALVQSDRENEILTGRQSKNPPVGSERAAFSKFLGKLPRTWTILVMSDGVWKYAGIKGVCKTASVKHGDEIIQTLLRRCRLPGSGTLQDDFTLAVFHGSASSTSSITAGQ